MPQSLSKVYVHIIFSTKYRQKLIDRDIQAELFDYIGGVAKALMCYPVQVGGRRDHIHILCTLSRQICQAELIQKVKQSSSKWIKTKNEKYSNFYWQDGYSIFSVKGAEVEVVKSYILNQEIHHKKIGFKEEYRIFLKKHNIEYDERYVWD
ncbi:MAG: IS200/IS605 family transposase [Balneolaceae bacterium]|nr:MAG: IS200/IS605 family transposase [Balneolaceae bacterium]